MRLGSASVALLVLTLATPATTTYAQEPRNRAALVATIKDATTGKAVAAEVLIRDQSLLVKADSDGVARLPNIAPGVRRIRVRMIGYTPDVADVLFGSDTIKLEFLLRPATVLDPIDVRAAAVPAYLRDFETRRRIGAGRYLREADLVRDGDRAFEDVVVSRFPGLRRVVDAEGRSHLASNRSSCGYAPPHIGMAPPKASCFSSKPCLIHMYLDDMLLAEEDFDLIRTWDLAAVESYSGANMPVRYRIPGSACGVMLLWTKRYDAPGSSPN